MAQMIELKKYLGLLPDKPPRDIKVLNTRQKIVVMLHLEGLSAKDIADETGFSPSYISTILRSEAAQNILKDYFSFADMEFKALYKLSIEAVRDALRSDDIDIRLKAADKFLKAHGKYNQTATDSASAEDVIRRIVEMRVIEETKVSNKTIDISAKQITE